MCQRPTASGASGTGESVGIAEVHVDLFAWFVFCSFARHEFFDRLVIHDNVMLLSTAGGIHDASKQKLEGEDWSLG